MKGWTIEMNDDLDAHIHIFTYRDQANSFHEAHGCPVAVEMDNLYGIRVKTIYDHRNWEMVDRDSFPRRSRWWDWGVTCRLHPEGEVVRA